MLHGNFVRAAGWKKICASLAFSALVMVCAIQCDSGSSPAPTPAAALTLVSPHGGESFSLTDEIVVKWQINPDSLNSPNINSFLNQYSLDSGANWYDMAVKDGSKVA